VDVAESSRDRSGRDRGQLMLIGAVAIAFVIIGLVVVVNTALVGGGTSGVAPAAESSEAVEFNDQVRRDLRETTIRVNQAAVYDDRNDLTTAMEENVSTYSGLVAESYATGGPTSVSVEYNYAERNGTRVVQAEDGSFTRTGSPTPGTDWRPLQAVGSPEPVTWLVLNLDAQNVSDSAPFEVVVTDENGDEARIFVERNSSPGRQVLAVDIRTDLPGTDDDTDTVTCSASNGRVLLDLLDGSSLGRDCSFNTTGPLDGPYREVEFRNGDRAAGKWSLVTDDPSNTLADCGSLASLGEPCNTPVVLEANVTTTYATEGLRYENTQNVTIYNESR
jgi:hypothetical protein